MSVVIYHNQKVLQIEADFPIVESPRPENRGRQLPPGTPPEAAEPGRILESHGLALRDSMRKAERE